MVTTELPLLGITEILFSELTANAPWQPDIRLRADTISQNLNMQSVNPMIYSQISNLPTVFHTWMLLHSRYKVISTFEQTRLITQLERLSFRSAGLALELRGSSGK